MIKYTLYIGYNDKITKTQLLSDDVIDTIITGACVDAGLDGFTLSHGRGYYKHDDGGLVFEKTCILDVLFVDDKTIRGLAQVLKQKLNQESIAIQKTKIDGFLV